MQCPNSAPLLILLFIMLGFSEFSILSWNIRGCMNNASKRQLREVLRLHKPSLCVIREPQGLFSRLQNFLYRNHYSAVHVSECTGRAGGIWCLQRMGSPYLIGVHSLAPRAITLKIEHGGCSWFFTAVYANPYYPARQIDWKHLIAAFSNITGPWLAMGDWNEILFSGSSPRG